MGGEVKRQTNAERGASRLAATDRKVRAFLLDQHEPSTIRAICEDVGLSRNCVVDSLARTAEYVGDTGGKSSASLWVGR